ncbi:MAG: hypothetical protein ABI690_16690 [Chloroflexota bacterium]
MAKARYRPRKEIKMWLYRDKADESRLIDFVQYCKQTRQLARVLRNGIRLMWSLGEGNTEILYELFPWLQTQAALIPPAPDTENLERQIADLKQIILQQGSISVPSAGYPLMKQIGAPPVVTPKNAPAADAGAIADNFLAFIQ